MRSPILTHPARFIPALGLLAALAAVALAAVALAAAPPALARAAHAGYVSSDPAANAVIKVAPTAVTIHFAEAVNPNGSGVVIYDAKYQAVSGAAQVESNDLTSIRIPMTGDDSEVYLVVWHTVSAADGDPDAGAFSFFVNASGASELAPTTGATTGPASTGAPTWLVILIAAVALLAGLAGGFAWARRSASAVSRSASKE